MSKLWTSMVLAVLYSAQLCADTAPAPTIGGTLSVNSFNVEWESWVESALDLPPVIRVQRLRRSCISKFCLICIIPIAVHLMDLETENWYLFIDWKISPGSQLRLSLSLSVRSNTNFNIQEVAWSYRRVDSRAVVDTQQREEQRRAASSSNQQTSQIQWKLGKF